MMVLGWFTAEKQQVLFQPRSGIKKNRYMENVLAV